MRLSSKKIVAVVILSGVMLVALAGAALAAPPWPDAPNAWWVSSYNVTDTQVGTVADGYDDGFFRPANPVTRGQLAKMAVNGLGVGTYDPAAATFKDVLKGSTYFIYVEGAYLKKIIEGYTTTAGLYFRPNNNVTRQQANSILGRYLSGVEINTTGVIHGTGSLTYTSLQLWYEAQGAFYLNGFLDAASVAVDHRPGTAYLIYHDIVEGSNGRLNPTSTLTRSQAAAMVLRVKAEAIDITTPPPAPTGLAVAATGTGKVVTKTGATEYLGNDSTPQVTGDALASSPIAVYDTIGGATTKLTEGSTNTAGKFYADITTALTDGTHSFTAKVKNAGGLVSAASAAVSYILDTVAPTGTITSPHGDEPVAVPAKAVFTVTATDERSGIKDVEFQVSVDQTTPDWDTISTDTTPDTGTNVYAAVWPTTGDLKDGLEDGQYLFRAIVTDKATNQKILGPITVIVDTVAPTVEITAPLGDDDGDDSDDIFYTESKKPAFAADAEDPTDDPDIEPSGIAKVEFFYAAWSASDPPEAWSDFTLLSTDVSPNYGAKYPTAGLTEGQYVFAVRATDVAGNQSALMDGNDYADGVTQEVIIDYTAPVVTITAPAAGVQKEEGQSVAIAWTVVDVTKPDNVKIEYTLDGSVGTPSWVTIAASTPNDGSHTWTAANVDGDKEHVQIRITAVDKAGAIVDDVPGHTTVKESGEFTIYDIPEAVTGLTGDDPDVTFTGVDGRDFHAAWTPSISTDIASQKLYILPSGVTLTGSHNAKATFSNNTQADWTGPQSLTTDSAGGVLAAGSYKIWIVVTDVGGHTATAQSPAFTVTAE